jgi:hypothetical protein
VRKDIQKRGDTDTRGAHYGGNANDNDDEPTQIQR